MAKGMAEDKNQKALEIAKKMMSKGLDNHTIHSINLHHIWRRQSSYMALAIIIYGTQKQDIGRLQPQLEV